MKCVGFGKLLKQLFIISLISCFGFGVNSFVSADNLWSEFGDRYCIGSSTFGQGCNFYLQLIDSVSISQMDGYLNSVDGNLNFHSSFNNSNGHFNFFVQTDAYANPVYNMSIFWYSGKLYFLNGLGNYYGLYVPGASDYAGQGFYSDYCYTSLTGFMDCVWDGHNRHDMDSFYTSFNPDSIVGIYAGGRGEYAHWSYGGFFCAKDNLDKFYCFLSTTGSLSFPTSQNTLSYEDVLNIGGIGDSPFGGGGGSIGYLPDTNRGVYDAYGENGYYLRNCYSDFSLNNLATSTGGIQQFTETELEDGEYYTGASVIDLYNYYSGGKTFSDWFSYWYMQYRNSISMDSPVNYVGKSKGLWSIAYKFYLAGRSADNLGFTQYYNYCSYFSNFTGSWNDDYNGPDLPPIINYYITINNSQYDTGVLGALSGKDLSFDPSSFYDTLTTRLNDLLDSPGSGYLGIIPPYILMVLMALIFIRIIQH